MSSADEEEIISSNHCPRCGRTFTERVEGCDACGLTFAMLNAQMSAPPAQAGYVNDFAQVLTPDEVQRLVQRCQHIDATLQAELIVVTTATTAPLSPAEYVFWLANRWDMGGSGNRGLLILLALQEHRIESEVGYGLESLLSDAESAQILQKHVVPFLRAEQYAEGLYQAVDVLGKVLEVKQKAAGRRWRSYRV
jgi:uncharacterized protein